MRTTYYEFDRAGRVKSVVAIPLGSPAKTYVTGVDQLRSHPRPGPHGETE